MTNKELKLFDKFSEIALSHLLEAYEIYDAVTFMDCEVAADAYGIAESMIIRRRIVLKAGIEDIEKVN